MYIRGFSDGGWRSALSAFVNYINNNEDLVRNMVLKRNNSFLSSGGVLPWKLAK